MLFTLTGAEMQVFRVCKKAYDCGAALGQPKLKKLCSHKQKAGRKSGFLFFQ